MRVLVVDDDLGLRQSLTLLLQQAGYQVTADGSPTRALDQARSEAFDIILCDVRMPEMEGLEFLRRYREGKGAALVIMMSAYGGEDAAIAAMKEGAYDYLPKPFRSDEVLLTLRKAEERESLRGQVASLTAELARWTDREVIAESPAMRKVLDLATRVAPHPTTVLITGESGTGKEVIARAIHRMSPRHDARFVAVNCGAIPEHLLESELFGHSRGAFTGATADKRGLFEEADGGTLLLDEVGDLPATLQVKLLRVLQEGEIRPVGEARSRRVDVRVLAATARDLERDTAGGTFREDLYYRLNVVRIHIPPLRHRRDDIPALAAYFIGKYRHEAPLPIRGLSEKALELLVAYDWPGNVRQLRNVVHSASIQATGEVIRPHDLPPLESPPPSAEAFKGQTLEEIERCVILHTLRELGGNKTAAAARLGVTPRTLLNKMNQYRALGVA